MIREACCDAIGEAAFDAEQLHHVERLAVVGDAAWEQALEKLARSFVEAETRFFRLGHKASFVLATSRTPGGGRNAAELRPSSVLVPLLGPLAYSVCSTAGASAVAAPSPEEEAAASLARRLAAEPSGTGAAPTRSISKPRSSIMLQSLSSSCPGSVR